MVKNQSNLNTDLGPFVAERSGTYWLSVEGAASAAETTNYTFALYRQAVEVVPLNIGQAYIARLGAGCCGGPSFSPDQASLLGWDQLLR
ncbi:MAG: hypothetical protein IPL70_00160 [Uliginosibacterium sp.]|nr:hypothetical protein [Uliginosibacterium sp.]